MDAAARGSELGFCSDGVDGLFAFYGLPDKSLFLQRISDNGTRLLGPNGILIQSPPGLGVFWEGVHALSDGAGGVYLVYSLTSNSWVYSTTYCERYDASGSQIWGPINVGAPPRTFARLSLKSRAISSCVGIPVRKWRRLRPED